MKKNIGIDGVYWQLQKHLVLQCNDFDENNNIKYLLVTTNADINDSNHVKDAINIYNYYFQNYKYQEIIKKDDTLVELKIKNDPKTVKKIKAKEPILLYLPISISFR